PYRAASPFPARLADGGRDDRGDRRRRPREETAISAAFASGPRARRGPNLLRPPCGSPQRRSHRLFRRPRIPRARRRRRRDHEGGIPVLHRVRDRPAHVALNPPPMSTLPRLDRTTPTPRGRVRGGDDQALLRSRVDGKAGTQPRRGRYPVGTAAAPEDVRRRRVRAERSSDALVAPPRNTPPADPPTRGRGSTTPGRKLRSPSKCASRRPVVSDIRSPA